ncbi:MAG: c-type cytochrome, partial [Nitrospirae bacterium]|nr:c-type cytochrome [Nitrospirota bacterium]
EARRSRGEKKRVGREIYNFRCYVCHGYQGDGRTLAALVLTPRPRDFTDPGAMRGIDSPRMFQSIKYGRPGTAMKPFSGVLADPEIEAVIAFIREVFVENRGENIHYHSPENQWVGFEQKYPEAIRYYFYRGDERDLPEDLARGRRIFRSSCVTCHLKREGEGGEGGPYFKPLRK